MTETATQQAATVKTTVSITKQQITDMIINARECGYSSNWLSSATTHDADGKRIAFNCIDEAASIVFVEREGGEGPHSIPLTDLRPDSRIGRGLQIMADEYSRHFVDLMNGSDDAETADVFLQCVCLGEVAYG